MSAALDALADECAQLAFEKLTPKIRALFAELAEKPADPLLTVAQAAKRMSISETALRKLEKGKFLKRVGGLAEIRFRQSAVDSYGKPEGTK